MISARSLRLGQTCEVALQEIAHLGKYPWEVIVWENALGKIPNIENIGLPTLEDDLKLFKYDDIKTKIYRP